MPAPPVPSPLRLLALALLCGPLLRAQSPAVTVDSAFLDFDVVGVEQGLGAGLVFDLAQDSLGYLWLGTRTGLCRYDGYTIRTFSKADGAAEGLTDNNVNRVYRDRRNLLWIDTELGGSRVFDPFRETWHRLSFSLGAHLGADGRGNLWFHGPDSTWRFVPATAIGAALRGDMPWAALSDTAATRMFPGAPLPRSSRLLAAGRDGLWVGALDSVHALRFNAEGTALERAGAWPLRHPQWLERQPAVGATDGRRMYWANAREMLVCGTDPVRLEARVPWPGSGIDRVLLDAELDQTGRFWLSGRYHVYRYAHPSRRLEYVFGSDPASARDQSQPFSHSYRILRDAHGNLWFATPGFGAYKRRALNDHFRYWGNDHKGPSIQRLCVDGDGHPVAWNVMTNARFKGLDDPVEPFLPPRRHAWMLEQIHHASDFWTNERGETVIYGVARIGERQRHFRLDRAGRLLESWSWADSVTHPSRLSRYLFDEGASAWSVTPDDFLRVDTREVRLYRWDTTGTGPFEVHARDFPDSEAPIRYLHASARTPDGSIWLAYLHGGLIRFRRGDRSWRRYAPDGDVLLPSTQVISLLPDPGQPDRALWIGTYDGLFRLDLSTDRLERFDRSTGLPDDVIYGILPDRSGHLWLSTNHGLCRFTPGTGKVRAFTREDGLQHDEFNRRSAARGPGGLLYFGGIGGVTWFDPEAFNQPVPPARLVIHDLRLFRPPSEARPGQTPSGADAPLHGLAHLALHQRDRIVGFGFSRLDLSRPEATRYRYRLTGFQDAWIDLGPRHEVTFTNLPPGRYTLEVQGMDPNGDWDPATARLSLGVTPYWYNSTAFRSAVLLLIVLGVVALFRYRQRQIERLHGLRDRISRDLHDEIGSTLSSIALFSTVARRKLDADPAQVATLLNRMEGSTQSVMESMNDIVWAIRSDQDRIHHVVQRMRAFLAEIAEARDWTFTFTEDPDIAELELSMVQRRNLYLIFKEAVHNAVKYSGGSHLEVALTRERPGLLLRVRDDGRGFDPDAAEAASSLGGNGLPNMRLRAGELDGTLVVDSAPGSGTTVTLRFRP